MIILAFLLNDFLLVGDTRSSLGLTSNVYQISLSTGSMTSLLSGGAVNPVGVAFDDVRMDVYWTDVSQKTVNRISLKNRTTSVVYTDGEYGFELTSTRFVGKPEGGGGGSAMYF